MQKPGKQHFVRTILILCLIVSALPLFAQFSKKVSKRAVVIGISDYQDEGIPDLQFAHKDAETAANYLMHTDPIAVPASNLILLTNQNATGGNVHQALNQLLTESKQGDEIIIFFSGHGDVETINEADPGHLLLYDTPSSTYQINSLRVSDLKEVIEQLSIKIGASVTLITDACRSGNLAGRLISGAQATASGLLSQFANETKILSCQPDEFSLEGTQWGGGRGAFSYHLIEGLTGLADQNKDLQVSILELQRYLEDRLNEDLNGSQTPVINGNKNKVLAFVDEDKMIQLIQKKASESTAHPNVLSSIFSENPENNQEVASSIIDAFYSSLENGHLIHSPEYRTSHKSNSPSALELFDSLSRLDIPNARIRGIKADFITALQDDSQKAINDYLKSTSQTLNDRDLGRGQTYQEYPLYLQKAAELLGPSHYLYSQLLAKSYYFDAVIHRLDQSYSKARELIEKALVYEDRAAYIFNELGFLYDREGDPRALDMYQLALNLSPNWVIPYGNMASYHLRNKNYEEAERYAQLSIEKGPHYKYAYWTLSEVFRRTNRTEEAQNILQEYLDKYGSDWFIYLKLGTLLKSKDPQRAIEYFKRSNEAQESKSAHQELGLAYFGTNDSLLVFHFKRALELNPKATELLNNLGWFYFLKDELDLSRDYYIRALEINPNILYARLNLGKIYFKKGELEQAKRTFNYLITSINPDHPESLYFLCRIAAINGETENALQFLEKAINNGYKDVAMISSDESLLKIREEARFIELIALIKS